MKYLLISIKDRAVDAFQPIASVRAHGEALRAFQDLITQNERYKAHPDDYDLYLVGYFDDQTGEVYTGTVHDDPDTELPKKIADGKMIRELNNN